jgi:hypothetical protein
MGCVQVRVKPDISVDQNQSKINVLQTNIKPDELDQSTTTLVLTNPTPVTMVESLMITPDEDLLTESTTLIRSRINVPNSVDITSNLSSEIPGVSSMSIISGEYDQLSSVHRFVISSSTDVERRTYRGDAINRFLPVRPKRVNNHQTSTDNHEWNESDESYSCHDSFLSSVSADSEESSSDRIKGIRTTFKKSNLQHKIIADDISSESDESHTTRNNSDFGDAKVMTDRLVTGLRSTSTRLDNPDYHLKHFITDTTSSNNNTFD